MRNFNSYSNYTNRAWDEGDRMYQLNSDGLMVSRHFFYAELPEARRAGWFSTQEAVLRNAGIIKSKFGTGYVTRRGGKWVPADPYGQNVIDHSEH